MSTTIEHSTPTGTNDDSLALADTTNTTSAQPPADNVKTKPSPSETAAEFTKRDVETGKGSDNEADDENPGTLDEGFNLHLEKPKNKRKKKGAAQRGPTALTKSRGTGFESFYADPPMTPEEAEEEKNDVYPPDRAFVDRIEECIQRYRARRRMSSARNNLFDKYLSLGGIDTTPRMFQGMRSLDTANASNAAIRGMTAGDVIYRGSTNSRYYNDCEPEHWDVDFSGIVAGYFSERIFKLAGTDLGIIKMAADVVENFLNYVLHHDVCPEYVDDINKAKAICQEAPDEIARCFRIIYDAPGDFTIACLEMFDKGKRKVYDPDSGHERYTMPLEQAQRVFYASVAAHTFLYDEVRSKPIDTIEVVDEVKQDFEVVRISEPDEGQTQLYLGVKDAAASTGKIKPCGVLTLKPLVIEDGYDKGSWSGPAPGIKSVENFVLDWEVLRHITVGMKLKLIVCIMNVDVKFIKAFADARPYYYTFLPQELMLTYKDPVPNPRAAPSIEDPDAGDEGGDDTRAED